ncbi:MAG: hypothetical protein Q8N77_00735 [Nanoarchaeota archaeon]|nr:hypothetical protein [Nanoarchaeota archaeon]
MEEKEKLERRRQIFHLLLGTVIVILYKAGILTINILFLIFLVGFAASFVSFKHKIPGIRWFLKRFERKEDFEKSPGKGSLMYLAGVLATLLLFEENTALAAIMVLAVGDSVSHMVGKYFGKRRMRTAKHVEGTIAGIFFASITASLFVKPTLAIIGSTAAMLTEAVELRIGKVMLDDNLIIPLIAGLAIHLANLL